MDQTQWLFFQQTLVAGITTIVTNWLKRLFPTLVNATPLQNWITAYVLAFGGTYLACYLTGKQCSWDEIVQYATVTFAGATGAQALLKTDIEKMSAGISALKVLIPTFKKPDNGTTNNPTT